MQLWLSWSPLHLSLSAWHKWQQKGEDSTRRARRGRSERPGWGHSHPIHLCGTPPYPRAFARAHSSAGDAFLLLLPRVTPAQLSTGSTITSSEKPS